MNEKSQNYINEHDYYREIVTMNTQYALSSPYVDTTVVRTPDSVMKGIYHARFNRLRGEEYLLNYRPNNRYFGFVLGVNRFSNRDALLTSATRKTQGESCKTIKLPKPKQIKMALSAVIGNRRSIRKFSGSMSLHDLSTVLFHSCGITSKIRLAQPEKDAEEILLRSHPSAGGLYPITIYVIAWKVAGIERGIYEYFPCHHSLANIKCGLDDIELKNIAGFGDIDIQNVSFCFAYTYQLYVNSHKYGDAGAAYAFIEAGEIAMEAQLCATALGCGGCDIGGYNKRFIERLLALDGISEQLIHFTIFGKGA